MLLNIIAQDSPHNKNYLVQCARGAEAEKPCFRTAVLNLYYLQALPGIIACLHTQRLCIVAGFTGQSVCTSNPQNSVVGEDRETAIGIIQELC